jgi:hypothetical protein
MAPMKKRKESRYSWLLFFIPIIIVAGLVFVAAYGSLFGNNMGELRVQAEAMPYHSPATSLSVQASVNGTALTTPSSLSLAAGKYTVSFASAAGYYPPTTRHVTVLAGKTSYAVSVFVPIKKVITFTPTAFNSTRITATHQVTPVFWVNISDQVVTLQSAAFGSRPIQPGGNMSMVFQSPGTFTFWIYGNSGVLGQVTVS